VGDWISIRIPILYPQKTCDYPHRIPVPTELRYPTYPHPTPCVFSLDVFLNKHIYAVRVTVLLCVFINDNTKKKNATIKQITDWTVFGEIQTATTTFIARLITRFRSISHPFESLHIIPTDPCGFVTVPIPVPMGIPVPTAVLVI